jgi:hypothetical protein
MATETPIVRHFVACSEITIAPGGDSVTLQDLIHAIVPLPGEKYPCVRESMTLYALLTNGRGKHEIALELTCFERGQEVTVKRTPSKGGRFWAGPHGRTRSANAPQKRDVSTTRPVHVSSPLRRPTDCQGGTAAEGRTMNPNHDAANPNQVHVLNPVEFDLSADQPQPAPLGKTAAPVRVLPAVSFNLEQPLAVPLLQLTLYLRPDADPAGLTLDVLRFFDALNRRERDLGGAGLTWDEARSQAAPGVVRLVVTPNHHDGAKERLTRLADAVTAAPTTAATVSLGLGNGSRSFVRWEAAVVDQAA